MSWDPAPSSAPPRGEVPPPGDVHLWPVRVAGAGDWLAFLPPAERERAGRYPAPGARDTFVISRALQRLVLSHYLGLAPADLEIRRTCARCGDTGHGRPSAGPGAPDYSVSHSGEWVVLALAGGGRVGADIEHGRSLPDIALLAGAALAPAERTEFDAVADTARPAWFYRMWTRKEAVVKATGQGLTIPIASLDVRVSPVAVPPADGEGGRLIHVRDLTAPEGYAGALATTGPVGRLCCCRPVPPMPGA